MRPELILKTKFDSIKEGLQEPVIDFGYLAEKEVVWCARHLPELGGVHPAAVQRVDDVVVDLAGERVAGAAVLHLPNFDGRHDVRPQCQNLVHCSGPQVGLQARDADKPQHRRQEVQPLTELVFDQWRGPARGGWRRLEKPTGVVGAGVCQEARTHTLLAHGEDGGEAVAGDMHRWAVFSSSVAAVRPHLAQQRHQLSLGRGGGAACRHGRRACGRRVHPVNALRGQHQQHLWLAGKAKYGRVKGQAGAAAGVGELKHVRVVAARCSRHAARLCDQHCALLGRVCGQAGGGEVEGPQALGCEVRDGGEWRQRELQEEAHNAAVGVCAGGEKQRLACCSRGKDAQGVRAGAGLKGAQVGKRQCGQVHVAHVRLAPAANRQHTHATGHDV
mmetsp:Transcript_10265/g.25797  ORF Transcript_10265/g.25797 Transcript_10265/m.25797 type:complete len:388 (+) Transcript_10265:227-1390(+)